jgi:cobalt-zinc-cadmium efflux system membrane fusion protein
VDWDQDHTTQAITQVNGPIARILVDVGTPVQKDQPLLYVSSPDVANAIAVYRKARNRERFNKTIIDRMKEMLDRGAVATKDYESSVADYNDAATDVQNSLQPLRIFGITAQEIDQAEQQGTSINTELAVRSPISGVVVQKLISPGMLIQAGQTVCFQVSDTSTVWVQGHIFDRDLPSVRIGDRVEETNPSFNRNFTGTIAYIGSFVDPNTRTTPVRIVTANSGGLLKKDMFIDAVIRTSTQNNILVVPVAAVLRDDKNEPIVYVGGRSDPYRRPPASLPRYLRRPPAPRRCAPGARLQALGPQVHQDHREALLAVGSIPPDPTRRGCPPRLDGRSIQTPEARRHRRRKD